MDFSLGSGGLDGKNETHKRRLEGTNDWKTKFSGSQSHWVPIV